MPIPQVPSPLTAVLMTETYNAAWFSGNTKEAQIQTAITAALTDGAKYVFVPANILPYDGTQVKFNTAVHMLKEGGSMDTSVFDLEAYGMNGGNAALDTPLLHTILTTLLLPFTTVKAKPGVTYIMSRQQLVTPGVFITPYVPVANVTLDFRGATLQVSGAAFNIGGGGGGLGVINFVGDNCTFLGTIDCNSVAAFGVALKMWDGTNGTGFRIDGTIINCQESFANSWTGISASLGTNVPGATITAIYHRNISGWLSRPQCPILDPATDTVTTHGDTTACLIGGPTTDTGASFGCLVRSTAQFNLNWQKPDPKGVWLTPKANDRNGHLLDLIINDLGCNNIELYGSMGVVPQRIVAIAVQPVDVNSGEDQFINITSNIAVVMQAPTNLPNASDRTWKLRFVFFNNSGGALTTAPSFAAGAGAFKSSATVVIANGQRMTVEFMYDKVNNLWMETNRSSAV